MAKPCDWPSCMRAWWTCWARPPWAGCSSRPASRPAWWRPSHGGTAAGPPPLHRVSYSQRIREFFYTGSDFFPSWIQGWQDAGSGSKNLGIFNPKSWKNCVLISQKNGLGCLSRIWLSEKWSGLFIPDPDIFPPFWIPDPGVKKAPHLGSGSATLIHSEPPDVRARIQFRISTFSWNPDLVRIQIPDPGFWWQKIEKNMFLIKN